MGPWAVVALIGLLLAGLTYPILPGRVKGGILPTLAVGVAGALAMTWLARIVGLSMPGYTSGFFTAVVGTGLVLAIWRTLMAEHEPY
jgi:uncharacterized membrane protein YeaQ/YmgE (transglycosylase-associated protein family)